MPDKQNDHDLEPLLDTQQNQLGLVMADGTAIDAKALAILASNIALLIFIGQASLELLQWQYAFLITPFSISLVLDVFAILPRAYLGAATDIGAHPEYLNMDKQTLLLQLLADTKRAIDHNRRVNAIRWRYCLISIAFTIVGTVSLFAIL